jgi:acetyl-CoA acetyltransferase
VSPEVRDIAIVSAASSTPRAGVQETETQMLFPVINEALERAGITRKDVGFTCSASCDYLAGAPFAFVQTLEATGAWPPIAESHVEMDGAWALYEAWVRLQHGDIDVALAFASGTASRSDPREVLCIQLDPYYLSPLWVDNVSLAALQARAMIDAGKMDEPDGPFVVSPIREGDFAPPTDAAAAVVLAAGDRARELCERPAWIAGIDHRIDAHYPGVRDLSVSASARIAGEQAGVGKRAVDAAHLAAVFTHEEILLREALELGDDVEVHTAVDANPLMVTGLIKIGDAAQAISEGGKQRTVGQASAGPCLQQNLVCVLEAGP